MNKRLVKEKQELVDKTKEYLSYKSTDGKPIRQKLREELKEMVEQ